MYVVRLRPGSDRCGERRIKQQMHEDIDAERIRRLPDQEAVRADMPAPVSLPATGAIPARRWCSCANAQRTIHRYRRND